MLGNHNNFSVAQASLTVQAAYLEATLIFLNVFASN